MPQTDMGVLLFIGAIFFLIGLLGGGFEISAIKIPSVGKYPRILAAGIGVIFMGIAVGRLLFPSLPSQSDATPVVSATPTPAVEVTSSPPTATSIPPTNNPSTATATPETPANTFTPEPTWTPTSTRVPTPSPTPPLLGKVLFEDNFDDNRNQWPSGKDGGGTYYIENGEYHVIASSSGGGWLAPAVPPIFDNFFLETKVRFLEGTQQDDAYGVLFRRSDPKTYVYVLGIAKQLFSLHNEDNVLVSWQHSPHIVPENDVNVIGVLCDDDKITLFINGHRVDGIQDDYSLKGAIGLVFSANEHIVFDYIRVSALAQ